MAASTRWRGNSIESPHNTIHVILGFPMTSVAFAAFHPSFLLHHCNVDRIYQKYLELEPDSREEMAAFQSRQATNRYEQPLQPFEHPKTGQPAMPSDMFLLGELGYAYDQLPETRPDFLREWPTYVSFWPIKPPKIVDQSYELHVWVVKAADERSWKAPDKDEDYDA